MFFKHLFRQVSAYFREVSAYFRSETCFQNFETSFEKFGAMMATYNDTNLRRHRSLKITTSTVLTREGCNCRFRKTSRMEGRHKVQRSVDPMFAAGLPSRCPKSKNLINSVQTRCIVKGEAQKVHFSGDFLGFFDFLRIACSVGIPQENL